MANWGEQKSTQEIIRKGKYSSRQKIKKEGGRDLKIYE